MGDGWVYCLFRPYRMCPGPISRCGPEGGVHCLPRPEPQLASLLGDLGVDTKGEPSLVAESLWAQRPLSRGEVCSGSFSG